MANRWMELDPSSKMSSNWFLTMLCQGECTSGWYHVWQWSNTRSQGQVWLGLMYRVYPAAIHRNDLGFINLVACLRKNIAFHSVAVPHHLRECGVTCQTGPFKCLTNVIIPPQLTQTCTSFLTTQLESDNWRKRTTTWRLNSQPTP